MSFGSTNENTQTWPSMDAVATYIEFDGVAGKGTACLWFLADPAALTLADVGTRCSAALVGGSVADLTGSSALKSGIGGGKGETETDVIDAEWAR